MGRDTIQLEDVISTISEEYLLEFTSEYGIPESLHPKLRGPEEPIVEFSEGKVSVYTKFFKFANYHMDLFNLISAPNPAKVKTRTRPRAAHEVQLLTVAASRVIEMEDTVVASGSPGTPSALEKSPLDFANEGLPQMITKMGGTADQVQDGLSHEIPPVETATTTEVVQEPGLEKEVATMGPPVNKRHRKRGNNEAKTNAPPNVLRKDHAAFRPAQSTLGGKYLALIGLEAGSTFFTPATQETPVDAKSMSDPEPLSSWKTAPEIPTENVATAGVQDLLSTESLAGVGRDQQLPPGYPGRMPRHGRSHSVTGVTLLKKATTKIARRDQRIQAREGEIKRLDQEIKSLRNVEAEVHGLRIQTKNLETLLEAEVDMKKVADAKNEGQAKELESLRVQFLDLQVSNNQLSQQYEDDRVEQRCAEMDARLDKLSVDFDEELYPHMLTAIAGCRWAIRHGLRLAVMKCVESPELRQAFANVVSAWLVKGISEGLENGIEHGKADRDLADVEAYDPEANSKYVKALQDLKDLKYSLVDQLEKLKDAPMELIMASLHLENPWVVKEEMLLEDAIAANISRAEKKKKRKVVCCTHGICSAHHARSDVIPVSALTIAPRGLAILLADAAT
ncbi:hypothetical protein Tco_0084577 [Tanacetum coccineum]